MVYLCAKFGDFSFSRFGFIVRTDTQTESQTDVQVVWFWVGRTWVKVRVTVRLEVNSNKAWVGE